MSEKDNELIVLWTSGLNKIHMVNLLFRISLLIMFLQFILSSLITPETLNYSRSLLKNSELQFVPSLLKERQFNDTVKGLTIFVDKKKPNGEYENIFIRDEGEVLTQVSQGSSTIFAKYGYVTADENILVLLNGSIQKVEDAGSINIIKFEKTEINLSGLSTKTISEAKIQETPTIDLVNCTKVKNIMKRNCNRGKENINDTKIELNKRFGMPLFIPLIALICCFLLTSRKDKKMHGYHKYIYFIIGVIILISSEITVRYSGISLKHTMVYYFLPISLPPLIYFILIRTFKYENLN